MEQAESPNYWIFQATPERYDLSRNIEPGKQDRWYANQNFRLMKRGDFVYFWQSGDRRGIYGWGAIESDGFYISDIDGRKSIDVRYNGKLSSPIPAEQLKEIKVIKSHRLFAPFPTGTNFKVTRAQAAAINELFDESEAPPSPENYSLLKNFSMAALESLSAAEAIRLRTDAQEMKLEHLVLALFMSSDEAVRTRFDAPGINGEELLNRLIKTTGADLNFPDSKEAPSGEINPSWRLSSDLIQTIEAASASAERLGPDKIPPSLLLDGIMSSGNDGIINILRELKIYAPKFTLKFKQISDFWTKEDKLGYQFYADAVSRSILEQRMRTPITVSIQAPWGQGKTSLMKMIQYRIDPDIDSLQGTGSQHQPPARFRDMFEWIKQEQAAKASNMLGLAKPKIDERLEFIPTVWFNPLYYQRSDQIWAGLAHAMLNQLSNRLTHRKQREEFWLRLQFRRLNLDAIKKDLRWFVFEKFVPFAAFYLVLTVAMFFLQDTLASLKNDLPALLKVLVSIHPALIPPVLALLHWIRWDKVKVMDWSIQDKFEKYISEPDYESRMGYLWLVDQDIGRALDLLVGDHPVAIFIDDLDRCTPKIVSEVIYAINQFITVRGRNIIFILGMDTGMVAEALEEARGFADNRKTDEAMKSFAWRFMEKFVQVPFFIPRLSDELTKSFLASFFERIDGKEKVNTDQKEAKQAAEKKLVSATSASQISEAIAEVNKYPMDEEVGGFMKKASDKLQKVLNDPASGEVEQLVELAVTELEYNPRSIKRFINVARLILTVQTLTGRTGLSEDRSRLTVVRATHLVLNWPQIIGWLQGQRSVRVDDEWQPAHVKLNEIALGASDYNAWKAGVNTVWGSESSILFNPSFYGFVNTISDSDPNLADIFESRVF